MGATEYEHSAPFEVPSLQSILVDNEQLADAGLVFTPVDELALGSSVDALEDDFAFANSTYRLSTVGTGVEVPASHGNQTLAQVIAPGETEAAVTYSAERADEYPSIHISLPGIHLDQLVAELRAVTDDQTRFEKWTQDAPVSIRSCSLRRGGGTTRSSGSMLTEPESVPSVPTPGFSSKADLRAMIMTSFGPIGGWMDPPGDYIRLVCRDGSLNVAESLPTAPGLSSHDQHMIPAIGGVTFDDLLVLVGNWIPTRIIRFEPGIE